MAEKQQRPDLSERFAGLFTQNRILGLAASGFLAVIAWVGLSKPEQPPQSQIVRQESRESNLEPATLAKLNLPQEEQELPTRTPHVIDTKTPDQPEQTTSASSANRRDGIVEFATTINEETQYNSSLPFRSFAIYFPHTNPEYSLDKERSEKFLDALEGFANSNVLRDVINAQNEILGTTPNIDSEDRSTIEGWVNDIDDIVLESYTVRQIMGHTDHLTESEFKTLVAFHDKLEVVYTGISEITEDLSNRLTPGDGLSAIVTKLEDLRLASPKPQDLGGFSLETRALAHLVEQVESLGDDTNLDNIVVSSDILDYSRQDLVDFYKDALKTKDPQTIIEREDALLASLLYGSSAFDENDKLIPEEQRIDLPKTSFVYRTIASDNNPEEIRTVHISQEQAELYVRLVRGLIEHGADVSSVYIEGNQVRDMEDYIYTGGKSTVALTSGFDHDRLGLPSVAANKATTRTFENLEMKWSKNVAMSTETTTAQRR